MNTNSSKGNGCFNVIGLVVLAGIGIYMFGQNQVEQEHIKICDRVLQNPPLPFNCEQWTKDHAPTVYADGSKNFYLSPTCAQGASEYQDRIESYNRCAADKRSGGYAS
jgi:hypothetical protein